MKHHRRLTAAGLAALAVMSVLTVVPGARAQTTTTPPPAPLAWGSNDRAQLALCLNPDVHPRNPEWVACPNPNLEPFSAEPVAVPGLGKVKQLSAGLSHSLALVDDGKNQDTGTVWAWGRNAENELGDGTSVYTHPNGWTTDPNKDPRVPDPAPDIADPVQVHQRTEEPKIPPSGASFTGITTIGPATSLTDVKAVAAGWYHNLALKDDGTVWAWGENFCGQLGNGKNGITLEHLSPPAAVKVPVISNVMAIAAGRGHSLALDEDGALWAWGDNRWGQLGDGRSKTPASTFCNTPDGGVQGFAQTLPVRVALGSKVLAVAAGSDHSLALTDDGTVWSWGNNCSAQLGSSADAVTPYRPLPAAVLGLPNTPAGNPVAGEPADPVVALAGGGHAASGHSLALTASGAVWAWGLAEVLGGGGGPGPDGPCNNQAFRTANPGVPSAQQGRLAPTPVVGDAGGGRLSGAVAVDAGVFHSLAIAGDGKVLAWGRNDVGQLGPVTPIGQGAVEAIDGPASTVSAGSHSLALPGDPPSRPTPTTLLPTVPDPSYVPLTPARIFDTRPGTVEGDGTNQAMANEQTVEVQVTGKGNVPSTGVGAVVLNVTAHQPAATGHLRVFPGDVADANKPTASNVNFAAGQTVANLVIAKVSPQDSSGAGGKVKIYAKVGGDPANTTHVFADVAGWFPAVSDYVPLTPARILDTRANNGAPMADNTTRQVQVTGQGGVPATGVEAVVLNVTATQPSSTGHLRVFPGDVADADMPTVSNLNFVAGQTVANLVIAKVGGPTVADPAGGKVKIYNRAGSTHVLADVAGWFPTGSTYNPLTPARISDTRPSALPMANEQIVEVQVTGQGGVPATGVGAVVLNVTATQPTGAGHLRVFPANEALPLASNLNFAPGRTVPNLVIAKVSPQDSAGNGGKIKIFAKVGGDPPNTTHVFVDVAGWFPASSDLTYTVSCLIDCAGGAA